MLVCFSSFFIVGLGLNINPLALLPGAQPPNKKTPGEEPVGFDQPMENSSILHSAQKARLLLPFNLNAK